MWIFTQHGFYSVVKKETTWHIRARAKQDLVNLGLTPVKSYPGSDYPWRCIIEDEVQWNAIMKQLAASVDYPNFKGRIAEKADQRHRLHQYHDIWAIMARE
ncbi:MAG: hypothetical protein ACAI35_19360 [Candidatus Methylacidiphilales bacterium]|nr:hypothetical protein [Candidatus Methylacidiphilales bacterium]